MIKIYVNLIRLGHRTLDEVPELWRDDVAKELEADEVVE